MKTIVLCLGLLLGTAAAHAAEPLAQTLQKGLFEEEASHNLPAAIEHYKSVITQTDQERKLAATALFRLGESYRKLGRDEDAKQAWSRILRDYSDQEELVKMVREKIPDAALVKMPGNNSINQLEQLLNSSPDLLNAAGTNGMTLLQSAIKDGDLEKMEFLIRRGADVNKGGTPPINLAAETGNRVVVEHLIKAGADINPAFGKPPLFVAAEHGFTQISELLISKGADVNSSVGGATPLYTAAEHGQLEEIELLARRGADLEKFGASGTPLIRALAYSNPTVALALLKIGANPNNGGPSHVPPIFYINYQYPETLTALLEAGANPDAVDQSGLTPLIQSARSNKGLFGKRIMEILLAHHADPNKMDDSGKTALFYAMISPAPYVDILLRHGANPNANDKLGTTPLLYALGAERYEITPENRGVSIDIFPKNIAALLGAKPDVNAVDVTGKTALFYAARTGNAELTEMLLSAGADPTITDKSRNHASFYAPNTTISSQLSDAAARYKKDNLQEQK